MNRTDPLAQYRQSNSVQQQHKNPTPHPAHDDCMEDLHKNNYRPPKNNRIGTGLFVAVFALFAILIWLVSKLA